MCRYKDAAKEDKLVALLAERIKHHNLKHPVAVQDIKCSRPGYYTDDDFDPTTFRNGFYLKCPSKQWSKYYPQYQRKYLSDPGYELYHVKDGVVTPVYPKERFLTQDDLYVDGQ